MQTLAPEPKLSIADEAEVKPLRILVAEDDPFTLSILQKRLSNGGYEVATATNGREGVEKATTFLPDIILSDWMMPEMDGLAFCRHVRTMESARGLYFILLTAKDAGDDKVSGLDIGADEYLVKPCDGRELMARLRAAERIVRLQRRLNDKNVALQRALLRINQELQATSQIQRALLPAALPVIEGYEFAAHYQPSTECSGDFYDFFNLSADRLCVVMGDVSGHGAPAMVAMALAHTLLQMEAPSAVTPSQLLASINDRMFQHLPTSQYATMFVAMLNTVSGELVYSSAGHNPPILIDYARSKVEALKNCEGYPIKLVSPGVDYSDCSVQLNPGMSLLLYTDGLVEAFDRSGVMFGTDGLVNACTDCPEHDPAGRIRLILERLQSHTQGRPLDDDLSLLAIQRR